MFCINKGENDSSEKLLKRFSGKVKSLKLQQKFRKLRYASQKPSKIKIRQAAVSRERYRSENLKQSFLR